MSMEALPSAQSCHFKQPTMAPEHLSHHLEELLLPPLVVRDHKVAGAHHRLLGVVGQAWVRAGSEEECDRNFSSGSSSAQDTQSTKGTINQPSI